MRPLVVRRFGKAVLVQPPLSTDNETKNFRVFDELITANKDQIPEDSFIF